MLKKNDIINLNVTGMTTQGSGVAKTSDGMVIFIPKAAVSDELEVRILKVQKNLAYGKIDKIIKPSKTRIDFDCPYFNKCGGCLYRHINYSEELRIKSQQVEDAIHRIGGLNNVKINDIIGSKNVNYYRNKAQLPIGEDNQNNIVMGFYAYHSHRIINCDYCNLQPKIFTDVMNIVRKFINDTDQDIYNEVDHRGRLRHLYIRYAEKTDELMVSFVVNANGLKKEDVLIKMLREGLPNIKSIIINSNREKTNVIMGSKNRTAWGSDCITDILCSKKFKISPLSFYQVNRSQAEVLYTIAKEYANLKGDEILLDLYCGTGTIGISMADNCKKLIGVEIIPQAVENAIENAKINNIENAEFICSDAKSAAQKLRKNKINADVIIIDPPRKGCESSLIDIIAQMNPIRVIYISCNASTLARDLKLFSEHGYITNEVTPVDMFPRTAHVETVVLMSKADK